MQPVLALISTERIVRNAALVKARAGVPLVAVVKDDAYGHGQERVALALEPHVAGFAVALVREGSALRTAGVSKPVLLLTPCLDEEEAARAFAYSLTPSATSPAALRLLFRAAERRKTPLSLQIAVNTGMNRYGFRPERVREACRSILRAGGKVEGVYSHLCLPREETVARAQLARFQRAADEVREIFPSALRHLAATEGVLLGREYSFDAVRCGLALYGYPHTEALPVRPAMKLYATCAHRCSRLGEGAGYSPAGDRTRFHTLRLGYGDGFLRGGEGPLGAKGALCMDALVQEGDLPFGKRKLLLRSVGDYARAHGISEYEALVSLTRRAERVYV